MSTAPIRFKVKLRYKNKDFVTVPLELSVAEGGSLDNIEAQPPSLDISRVQLQGPDSIPLLPLRYQIAQKLHACTEDLGPEQSNQRARDLHGLLLIEELGLDKKDLPAVPGAGSTRGLPPSSRGVTGQTSGTALPTTSISITRWTKR